MRLRQDWLLNSPRKCKLMCLRPLPVRSPLRWNTSRFTGRHWKAIWKVTQLIATSSCSFHPAMRRKNPDAIPVVYALHGYSIGAEQWTHEIHVPQTIEGAFAQGAKEMIVVLPDSKTLHNGSMYSSSVTTGDFEQFIAHDLVAYIDAHYRTISNRQSRGLVGHSMGGYGATRIGMKHSDVFGSLYIMSPCCLSPRPPVSPEIAKSLEAAKTPADSASLPFFARATLASAAAWSPNPKNPPLYLDLPTKEGAPQPDVLAKWAANAPLAFMDQYIGGLRRYRAISWM